MKTSANGLVSLSMTALTLLGAAGCGAVAPDSGESATDGADSSELVGMKPLMLRENSVDHPAVAAIGPSEFEWVFACDGNFRLMRSIGVSSDPSNWTRIAKWTSCAGVPAAAYFEIIDPRTGSYTYDKLVFWRDLNSELWEVRFNGSDGHTETTNLSTSLGFGRIRADPVVANLGNDTGAMNAVALVIEKLDANNELWTVEFKSGAWSVNKVLRADGSTAVGYGRPVTAFGLPSTDADRTFISTEAEGNKHVIYARQFWGHNYTEYAYTDTAQVLGQLTIAHKDLFGNATVCAARGCAMYRDKTTNYLMFAPLSSGGNLTSQFKTWDEVYGITIDQEPGHMRRLGSSLAVSPDPQGYVGLARSEDGWPLRLNFTNGSSVRCTRNNSQIVAAPTPALTTNGYSVAFYVDTNYQLKTFTTVQGCGSGSDMAFSPFFN